MSLLPYTIRKIQLEDNPAVARLIRSVMTEYGATGEGYSIHDSEVDHMFEAYNNPRSAFFVVVADQKVYGCAGIGPLKGGDESTCELKKMYFYSEIRGLGLGSQIIQTCLNAARSMGYRICYLETIASMTEANSLYQKSGFNKLSAKMGNTGHSACNTCYALDL